MHVKKGDNVEVLAGASKGKKGKVLRVFPLLDKVIVEGVNVVKRHQKATRMSPKGQIVEKTLPIHISNVRRTKEAKK